MSAILLCSLTTSAVLKSHCPFYFLTVPKILLISGSFASSSSISLIIFAVNASYSFRFSSLNSSLNIFTIPQSRPSFMALQIILNGSV